MKNKSVFFGLSAMLFLSACGKTNNVKIYIDSVNGAGGYETIEIAEGKAVKDISVSKRGCKLANFVNESNEIVDPETTVTEGMKLKAVWDIDEEKMFEMPSKADEKEAGSKARVMSFNVLSDDWNNKPQMHGYDDHNVKYPEGTDNGRDVQFVNTLNAFLPDVVGVQEFDDEWYATVSKYNRTGELPYKAVNAEAKTYQLKGRAKTIYTTILYNEDTVTLKEYKHQRFATADTNENCRSITYGVFTLNATNEDFIVTSSHWNHLDSSDPNTPARDREQAEENARIWKELDEDYGLPMVCVGDMNQIDSDQSIKALATASGFADGKYSAEKRGLCCDTYHIGNGESKEPEKWYRGVDSLLPSLINTEEARDHVYLNSDVTSKYFDTVSTIDALNSSDHMPIYVDVAW